MLTNLATLISESSKIFWYLTEPQTGEQPLKPLERLGFCLASASLACVSATVVLTSVSLAFASSPFALPSASLALVSDPSLQGAPERWLGIPEPGGRQSGQNPQRVA